MLVQLVFILMILLEFGSFEEVLNWMMSFSMGKFFMRIMGGRDRLLLIAKLISFLDHCFIFHSFDLSLKNVYEKSKLLVVFLKHDVLNVKIFSVKYRRVPLKRGRNFYRATFQCNKIAASKQIFSSFSTSYSSQFDLLLIIMNPHYSVSSFCQPSKK